METEFPEVFALDAEQKIELMGALWDSVAESVAQQPVPGWLKTELDRQFEGFLKDPTGGIPLDVMVERLESRYERIPS